MSLDKAREILKQAMTDRSVYDAIAASENEVWVRAMFYVVLMIPYSIRMQNKFGRVEFIGCTKILVPWADSPWCIGWRAPPETRKNS